MVPGLVPAKEKYVKNETEAKTSAWKGGGGRWTQGGSDGLRKMRSAGGHRRIKVRYQDKTSKRRGLCHGPGKAITTF